MKRVVIFLFLLILIESLESGCCGSLKRFSNEPQLTDTELEIMVRKNKERLKKEIKKGRVVETAWGYYLNPTYISPVEHEYIRCEALHEEFCLIRFAIPGIGGVLNFKRILEYFLNQ